MPVLDLLILIFFICTWDLSESIVKTKKNEQELMSPGTLYSNELKSDGPLIYI